VCEIPTLLNPVVKLPLTSLVLGFCHETQREVKSMRQETVGCLTEMLAMLFFYGWFFMAGMPKRKLFLLLKVSCCHFSGKRSELSPTAAAFLVRREILAWHLAWAFLPKMLPWEFSTFTGGDCI